MIRSNLLLITMLLSILISSSSCPSDNGVGVKQSGKRGIKKDIVPYLYIQESEGQMGGMRSVFKAIYLAVDGVGQLTVEGSDDTAEQLVTSSVKCKSFLQELDKLELPPRPKPKPLARSSGTLVTEFSPASIYVEILTTKSTLRKWSCSPNVLPKQVVELMKKAKDMIVKGEEVTKELVSKRYMRSSILSKTAVKDMRRAKIIQDISLEKIREQQLVYFSVTHPRMLISVPEDVNPYQFVQKSFQRGRSIQLSVEDISFQVRNIKKLSKPKQKEKK